VRVVICLCGSEGVVGNPTEGSFRFRVSVRSLDTGWGAREVVDDETLDVFDARSIALVHRVPCRCADRMAPTPPARWRETAEVPPGRAFGWSVQERKSDLQRVSSTRAVGLRS
jgi:hypothetical protein